MRAVPVLCAALLLSACGGTTTASSPTSSAPPVSAPASSAPASSAPGFVSTVYGYEAAPPSDWTVTPASTAWDGGDIDHTADYVDYLTDPAGNEYFVLGTAADGSLAQVTDEHIAWLTDNRGCPAPSARTDITIDGQAAERLSIHCDGVFGPTLVSKAIVLRDGNALVVTSFSPDEGTDAFASFDAFVSSIRWPDS